MYMLCKIPTMLSFFRPFIWSIISFMPTKAYQKRDLPKFSLLPDPEDGHQNSEWGKFMRFLSDNKKVNIFFIVCKDGTPGAQLLLTAGSGC